MICIIDFLITDDGAIACKIIGNDWLQILILVFVDVVFTFFIQNTCGSCTVGLVFLFELCIHHLSCLMQLNDRTIDNVGILVIVSWLMSRRGMNYTEVQLCSSSPVSRNKLRISTAKQAKLTSSSELM